MYLCGKGVCSWCDGSLDRSFMVDPLSYLSFQPVLHDWCNNGRDMCYPVRRDDAYKRTLAPNQNCGDSGFPLSLSEWSSTMSDAL